MSEPVRIEVELLKGDEIRGVVYGVVLQPGVVDSQGDVVSAEEIRQAAHSWMSKSAGATDIQHSGAPAGAVLIENYCAPHDLVIGGRRVLGGSWVQGWQITDPGLKREVREGRRTGFSIEGRGERHPIAA